VCEEKLLLCGSMQRAVDRHYSFKENVMLGNRYKQLGLYRDNFLKLIKVIFLLHFLRQKLPFTHAGASISGERLI
jgi:hypothetical protein